MGSGIIECHCEGSCGDDNKHHVSIEAESFDGLISGITQNYTGITVNNTMKFSKIKSVVTEYINALPFCSTNICSFIVRIGISPQPIKDHQVNCDCKQTTTGKYKTESECLDSKIAPDGYHYMPDGSLMLDSEHETLYDSPNSNDSSNSSSSSVS